MNAHERTNPSVSATMTLAAEKAITMPVKRSRADRKSLWAAAMSSLAVATSVLIDSSSMCEVGCSSFRWMPVAVVRSALVDQRDHLLAGLPVVLVDGPDVLVERGVARLGSVQLVQELGEVRLGLLDLPVVLGGIVGDEQRHRPVVALRRHRIEHLLRTAGLHLRSVELDHAIVHLPDDEEAEPPPSPRATGRR